MTQLIRTAPTGLHLETGRTVPQKLRHTDALVFSAGLLLVDVTRRLLRSVWCRKDFGYVEALVREALTSFSAKTNRACCAHVATKGGMQRVSAESSGWRMTDCTGDDLYRCIEKSRQKLLGDQSSQPLFLWQVFVIKARMLWRSLEQLPGWVGACVLTKDGGLCLHSWVSQVHHFNTARTPLAQSLQGVARAQREGKVLHVGLCNVTVDEIIAARQVVKVVSVQNKFNLWERWFVLSTCVSSAMVTQTRVRWNGKIDAT